MDWPADIGRNPSGPGHLYIVLFLGVHRSAYAYEFKEKNPYSGLYSLVIPVSQEIYRPWYERGSSFPGTAYGLH
jgi:hypothetical protein